MGGQGPKKPNEPVPGVPEDEFAGPSPLPLDPNLPKLPEIEEDNPIPPASSQLNDPLSEAKLKAMKEAERLKALEEDIPFRAKVSSMLKNYTAEMLETDVTKKKEGELLSELIYFLIMMLFSPIAIYDYFKGDKKFEKLGDAAREVGDLKDKQNELRKQLPEEAQKEILELEKEMQDKEKELLLRKSEGGKENEILALEKEIAEIQDKIVTLENAGNPELAPEKNAQLVEELTQVRKQIETSKNKVKDLSKDPALIPKILSENAPLPPELQSARDEMFSMSTQPQQSDIAPLFEQQMGQPQLVPLSEQQMGQPQQPQMGQPVVEQIGVSFSASQRAQEPVNIQIGSKPHEQPEAAQQKEEVMPLIQDDHAPQELQELQELQEPPVPPALQEPKESQKAPEPQKPLEPQEPVPAVPEKEKPLERPTVRSVTRVVDALGQVLEQNQENAGGAIAGQPGSEIQVAQGAFAVGIGNGVKPPLNPAFRSAEEEAPTVKERARQIPQPTPSVSKEEEELIKSRRRQFSAH